MSRSLTSHLEKRCRDPNSLTKEEVVVFTTVMKSAYQGQVNCFFSKVCDVFLSLRHRIFTIRLRVLPTGLLLWRHLHAPKT